MNTSAKTSDSPPDAGIRDIASINDAVDRSEHDRWSRGADDIEIYGLDRILLAPVGIYIFALIWRRDVSDVAYVVWAVAALVWTPWIILRVDNSRPRGDTARAAAWLGIGLLGWPLSFVVMVLAPEGAKYLAGFPVAFAWSVAAALWGAWPRPIPPPSSARARLFTGGAASYICAALALAAVAVAMGRAGAATRNGIMIGAAVLIFAVAGAATAAGLGLLRTALRTWRAAAASPRA